MTKYQSFNMSPAHMFFGVPTSPWSILTTSIMLLITMTFAPWMVPMVAEFYGTNGSTASTVLVLDASTEFEKG